MDTRKQATYAAIAIIAFTLAEKVLPDIARWLWFWQEWKPGAKKDGQNVAIGLTSLIAIGSAIFAATREKEPIAKTYSAIFIICVLALVDLLKVQESKTEGLNHLKLTPALIIWGICFVIFVSLALLQWVRGHNDQQVRARLWHLFVLTLMAALAALGLEWAFDHWVKSLTVPQGAVAIQSQINHVIGPTAAVTMACIWSCLAPGADAGHPGNNGSTAATQRRAQWLLVYGAGLVIAFGYGALHYDNAWPGSTGPFRPLPGIVGAALVAAPLMAAMTSKLRLPRAALASTVALLASAAVIVAALAITAASGPGIDVSLIRKTLLAALVVTSLTAFAVARAARRLA